MKIFHFASTIFILSFSTAAFAAEGHSDVAGGSAAQKKKSSQAIQDCMKAYKKTAAEVCKDFGKLDLSENAVKKTLAKIEEITKADNMWWTEQRIAEAKKFLSTYKSTSSNFRVGQERWCAIGEGPKSDEYEKSLALAEERCKGGLSQALAKDSKELVELSYMLNNLSGAGLSSEAEVADKALKRLRGLKKQLGAYSNADIEKFIVELATAADESGSKNGKKIFKAKLKECYELEKAAPAAFKAPRANAPSGYDCASFDKRENP